MPLKKGKNKAEDWQNLVIAFKQAFSGESGRRVMEYLSYQCYESRNTFVDGNEVMGQRNLGRREIILFIRDWLSKDPQNIPENLRIAENGNTGSTMSEMQDKS